MKVNFKDRKRVEVVNFNYDSFVPSPMEYATYFDCTSCILKNCENERGVLFLEPESKDDGIKDYVFTIWVSVRKPYDSWLRVVWYDNPLADDVVLRDYIQGKVRNVNFWEHCVSDVIL